MTINSPTYEAATRQPNGVVHLSEDGHRTLCGHIIGDKWQRHDERIDLFVIWISGVFVCRQCSRIAIAEREIIISSASPRPPPATPLRLELSNQAISSECNRHVAMTVDIGDLGDHESGAQLCIDCLRAAVALLEAALEAATPAPQEEEVS